MGLRVSLARTAIFAALYAAATIAGRMTVLDEGRLALVWPAAGVAVVWFCAQRRAAHRWVDVLALATIALVGNASTGTGPALAAVLAVANVAQTVLFGWLLGRRRPTLWGGGGNERLSTPRELACVLGMTVVASAAGTVTALAGLSLLDGHLSGLLVVDWLTRQAAGMFVIGTAGLWFGPTLSGFRSRHGSAAGWWRAADRAVRAIPAWRLGEYAAVTVCSAAAYLLGFVYDRGLPLLFPLIAVTVWAAARLRTSFVVLHGLTVGAASLLFTLHGDGPMANIADPHVGALFAQVYVILVAVVGLSLALGRDERATLMAKLCAQQQELARHAALTSAIIDSMADGLAVVDANGEVLLNNPAAVRLLERPTGPLTPAEVRARLHHLDGTPIADADLPNVRALTEGRIDPVDLLVQEPGGRDSRVFRVTATTLPEGHGTSSAVVLYHEVTAEHRRRDQLTSFAGIVAHDLQSPLTTVEGWAEAAADALDAEQPTIDVDQARDSIARVSRAAVRMRGLINDLLANTAARDAALHPSRVDLTGLVGDIATGRADAAAASEQPVPQVALGRLHPVYADAGAVRQLLENLIGNAIKYTAAGVTPHVRVTSTRVGGVVQVTIADNGIGIPAGQHEVIFDNFHRAHAGQGYTGTGLGLAICHRIVTRHGGTITADDNPGGGSRFTFTLPAADPPPAARKAAEQAALPPGRPGRSTSEGRNQAPLVAA
ncbi:ATP-binding protein [Krasilnikovia sp. M28-CT-15]|uniref:ATP-binding protein n=1 Tax=Krasilnikovia sp. M28-CT-15 TaxID=3373540 RepID=UPI003876C746